MRNWFLCALQVLVFTGPVYGGISSAGDNGHLTISTTETNVSVYCGGVLVPIPAGEVRVPAMVDAVISAGGSNYVGDYGLIDGCSISVAPGGLVIGFPDTLHRENSLLMWGSAGLATGAFMAFLSLLGFVFRRGLKPSHWGGGDA